MKVWSNYGVDFLIEEDSGYEGFGGIEVKNIFVKF